MLISNWLTVTHTKEEDVANIYLAGGLFNIAEQAHNLFLELTLAPHGHNIVLPQRRAELYRSEITGECDTASIRRDCVEHCTDPSFITVACSDGADIDGGTSYEIAAAEFTTGRAVVYRTDFRTVEGKEIGVNCMLRSDRVRYVYYEAHLIDIHKIEDFYKELARRIDIEIRAFQT